MQEATELGATVVALAGSTRKAALAPSLGAGVAVDYQRPGWTAEVRYALAGRIPTVALDGVGGAVRRAVFELLGRGGRLVRFGWASGAPAQIDAGEFSARDVAEVRARIPQQPDASRLLGSTALEKAASGAWRPRVDVFPLLRASAAHQALESSATTGKVVLVP